MLVSKTILCSEKETDPVETTIINPFLKLLAAFRHMTCLEGEAMMCSEKGADPVETSFSDPLCTGLVHYCSTN